MASRGLGFERDTIATHDGDAASYLRFAARMQVGDPSVRRPFQWLADIGGVGDQGQTSSCVGWTFVEAIALRARALGVDLPRGSELAAWALARQLAAQAAGQTPRTLPDRGCEPSLCVQALRAYGLPSQASFPWDPTQYGRRISLEMLESADATIPLLVRGFYGITATGPERIDQVASAIDSGHPVALAVCASTASFQGAGPDTTLYAWDPTLPHDHMVSLVDRDAYGRFLLLNHWGTDWGLGGLVWVDPGFVLASSDLFVVDVGRRS